MKVFIVRLLVEVKGTDMDDKFGEERRQSFTQLLCRNRHLLLEDCLVIPTNGSSDPR